MTTQRPGAYEQHLIEQLHILRIQAFGPLGMERPQWIQFRRDVTDALQHSQFPDAQAFLRGSAVSGVSFRRGVLSEAGPRDFDAAIVSPGLFAAARRRGVEVRGASRTEPLHAAELAALGAPRLPESENGRRITYVVFSSPGAMYARPGPAIPLHLP